MSEDIVKRLAEKSTVHCIAKLANAKNNSIKLMWIVSAALTFSICASLILNSITDYLKFELVTSIQYIDETMAEFPTITICNSEALITNEARNLYDVYRKSINVSNEDLITYIGFLNLLYFNSTVEQKKALSLSYDNTIISCSYNHEICDIENDFSYYYHYFYGNCYQFNSGYNLLGHKVSVKNSSSQGLFNGAVIDLFIGFESHQSINSNPENFGKGNQTTIRYLINSSKLLFYQN
jgi:hypothetical protein